MMLGTIGYHDRMDVTVISDAVNLASRLEHLTKDFGSHIIISHDTFNLLEDTDAYPHRYLGKMRIEGRESRVPIYEIFCNDIDKNIELKCSTNPLLENALNVYDTGDYEEIISALKAIQSINPHDKIVTYWINKATYAQNVQFNLS